MLLYGTSELHFPFPGYRIGGGLSVHSLNLSKIIEGLICFLVGWLISGQWQYALEVGTVMTSL